MFNSTGSLAVNVTVGDICHKFNLKIDKLKLGEKVEVIKSK